MIDLTVIKELLSRRALCTHFIGDEFLDGRYQIQIDETGNPSEYYRYFYYLTKLLEPKLTVELGGWQGTAAAHLAAGYKAGKVVTIDHHTDPGDDLHRIKMMDVVQQYPNVFYLQGWTWDLVEEVKTFGTIDILFIDSWHDYEHAMRDWNDYSKLLSDEALVICDDILGGYGPVISGMIDFWDELNYEKFITRDIHSGMDGIPVGFLKYANRS